MRFALFLVIAGATVFAQPFSLGVKIGAPLNDAFDYASGSTSLSSEAAKFTIGPTVELRLPFGLGVEADALYRRLRYDTTAAIGGASYTLSQSANSWEIPILGKYRFGFPLVKPFVDAGPSFRYTTNIGNSLSCLVTGCGVSFASKNAAGFTMGGGVEIHALFLRVSPELRYTRWGSSVLQSSQTGTGAVVQASQNEAQFLVGITF